MSGSGGCQGNQANQSAGGDVGKRGQGTFGGGGECGDATQVWCSGGGGGWYGGAAPAADAFGGCNAGGGGSGHIAASVINGSSRGNANGGEGKVTIVPIAGMPPAPPTPPAPGSGCDAALAALCDAARCEGGFECALCIGAHEKALLKAGCPNPPGAAGGEAQLFCRNETCTPQLQNVRGGRPPHTPHHTHHSKESANLECCCNDDSILYIIIMQSSAPI